MIRETLTKWLALVAMGLGVFAHPALRAADWPTHLHDNHRSGASGAELALPLAPLWVFKTAHPPTPAWSLPIDGPIYLDIIEQDRLDFDRWFQPVSANGRVYFGSSADNKVYCLDAATGEIVWSFFTEGPVRLAPTVSEGLLYFGSDDGLVYCLDAATGNEVWTRRLGPSDRRHLGSGRMISRWPIRTSVLIDSGLAYVGAGVFPSEGVILAALDARTGENVWFNDTTGYDDAGRSDFSPQGYLLASPEHLFAPAARAMPAAFRRNSGQMLYQASRSWRHFGPVGGTYALLVGDHLFSGANQAVGIDVGSGRVGFAWFPARRMVVSGELAYMATATHILALNRQLYAEGTQQLVDLRRTRAPFELRHRRASQRLRRLERVRVQDREPDHDAALEQARQEVVTFAAEMKPHDDAIAEVQAKLDNEAILWRTESTLHSAMIRTANLLWVGGDSRVAAFDPQTGREVFGINVDGRAGGLAIAGGRLLITTDTGTLYAYEPAPQGAAARPMPAVRTAPVNERPFGERDGDAMSRAAEAILEHTGIRRGFALVVGSPTGRLALELARRSDLNVYAIEPDEANVAAARKAIHATGLYGVRVTVDHGPLDRLPYANFFADLIVSETALTGGELPTPPAELRRLLKPGGGTLMLGLAGAGNAAPERLRETARIVGDGRHEAVRIAGGWFGVTRPTLEGAGSWTHMYADTGNTACGADTRARLPLSILWYGEPGPGKMINRHASGIGPVSTGGRLFMQGNGLVMAYDAYNGYPLWERDMPGARRAGTKAGQSSGMAATETDLFIAVGAECLRLDPLTGETRATYRVPEIDGVERGGWGHLIVDGNLLVGSSQSRHGYSNYVFGIDIATGETLWTQVGANIPNIAIALSGGTVYFADSSITAEDRDRLMRQSNDRLRRIVDDAERRAAEEALKEVDFRRAFALDAATGRVKWSAPLDLTAVSGFAAGGGELTLMARGNYLVFSGANANGHYWQQFMAGDFRQRTITVISAETGSLIWSRPAAYKSRPILLGDTIIAEPFAFDVRTGRLLQREHPITAAPSAWQLERQGWHCGTIAGTESLIMFRSGHTGFYDHARDEGTFHIGGVRAGCWVNFVAASGLVLIQEASAGCQCLYPIQATMALEPVARDESRMWGQFSAPGPHMPVNRLSVNFGAPGDRRDDDGAIWLRYPRVRPNFRNEGALAIPLEFTVDAATRDPYYLAPDHLSLDAPSPLSWVYTSGVEGLRSVTIPVLREGDAPGRFAVRLHFAEVRGAQAGQRLFDVRLQGQVVAQGVDIAAEAGGPNRALVRAFDNVEIAGALTLELVASPAAGQANQPPLLSGIEIVRTDGVKLEPADTPPPPWAPVKAEVE